MVDEQATASWVAKVPEVTLVFWIIKILCTTIVRDANYFNHLQDVDISLVQLTRFTKHPVVKHNTQSACKIQHLSLKLQEESQ